MTQWYEQMKNPATCCSFVAHLNCNKTNQKQLNSESRSYFNIFHQANCQWSLSHARISHPQKVQPTELHRDSIHLESSLKQTLQQDLSNFHGLQQNRHTYHIPLDVTWIYTWARNDVTNLVSVLLGYSSGSDVPRHSLICAAWMQLASVTKRIACASLAGCIYGH